MKLTPGVVEQLQYVKTPKPNYISFRSEIKISRYLKMALLFFRAPALFAGKMTMVNMIIFTSDQMSLIIVRVNTPG
jgi:hypothetical protein